MREVSGFGALFIARNGKKFSAIAGRLATRRRTTVQLWRHQLQRRRRTGKMVGKKWIRTGIGDCDGRILTIYFVFGFLRI